MSPQKSPLEQTELWATFAEIATVQQKAMVLKACEKAAEYLKLIRDTFPTYTLHDEKHALNVVKLMGKLLGEKISELNALEAAVLLLSAYLHDAGMVFKPTELDNIADEEDFQPFLSQNPNASVILNEAQREDPDAGIPEDVIEWFCRWNHPKRVLRAISDMSLDLRWDGIDISQKVSKVCESHGWDAHKLHSLELNFRKADLVLCGVLLRLADILDFDNTRSPDVIYHYLQLPEIGRQDSDKEWRKHYASAGFEFDGSKLIFNASPDMPSIEYDIREFLAIIERELGSSRAVLQRSGSDRWRTLDLPTEIDPQITSIGYKYGEHRFTLEQDQVLELFMGEKLYSNQYVFVRELVQNAIDTSRHRIIYENAHGKPDYEPVPIQLTAWTDKAGYQWVRVDDYGMGMTEEHIVNYLLRVGNSYYRSSDFKAEIGHYEANMGEKIDFLPISRFGIGLLSCFIAGEMLEISTRRVPKGKEKHNPSLRLTMKGLQSFYTLRESGSHLNPPSMPNNHTEYEGYRSGNNYGTSVAVRLNSRNDHSWFNPRKLVEENVITSPIPIEFEGERIGYNYKKTILDSWVPERTEILLESEEYQQIEEVISLEFNTPPKIVLEPLDFTNHRVDANLLGQGLFAYIDYELSGQTDTVTLDIGGHFNKDAEFSNSGNPFSIGLWYQDVQTLIMIREHPEISVFLADASVVLEKLDHHGTLMALYLERFLESDSYGRSIHEHNSLQKILQEIARILAHHSHLHQEDISNLQRRLEDIIARFPSIAEKILWSTATFDFPRIDSIISDLNFPEQFVANRQQCRKGKFWSFSIGNTISHNGILTPLDNQIILFSDAGSGWVAFHVMLFDSLRPELSLARDKLRSFPWSFYSSLMLTVRRAAPLRLAQSPIIVREDIIDIPSLDELCGDILLTTNEHWKQESLFDIDEELLSIADLEHVSIPVEELGYRNDKNKIDVISGYNNRFVQPLQILKAALIQMYLDVKFSFEISSSNIYSEVTIGSKKEIDAAFLNKIKTWHPLSFVPYNELDDTLQVDGHPVNLVHPFAQWLVEQTPILDVNYPGILERLRGLLRPRNLYTDSYFTSWPPHNEINRILQRLNELDFPNAWPESKFLTRSDFKSK